MLVVGTILSYGRDGVVVCTYLMMNESMNDSFAFIGFVEAQVYYYKMVS